MRRKIESALGCLLILCLLLTGCTAPSGDTGIQPGGQSQQTEENQENSDNQTAEAVPGEPLDSAQETGQAVQSGQMEQSEAPSDPLPTESAEHPNEDVLSAQVPSEQEGNSQGETAGTGVAASKPETAEVQDEGSAEEGQDTEPQLEQQDTVSADAGSGQKDKDALSADAGTEAPEVQQDALSADAEKAETQKALPNPNTGEGTPQSKSAAPNVLKPTQPGTESYSDSSTELDASNSSEGYVSVKYSGSSKKVKLRITKSGGTTYTYNISTRGSFEIFPLSAGSGTYSIEVFENVSGNQYAPGLSKKISAKITNSLGPFLYPNKFVNFNANSAVVATATSLSQQASDDLDFVAKVYDYTLGAISYDDAKAAVLGTSDYVPDVDATCSVGTGVCFDYAAVMAAMLRSQGIPTQLVVGIMNGNIKHAWVNVYITNVGWIHQLIYFDGNSWVRMDPTTADQNNEAYTTNNSNYQTMYVY